MIIKDGLVYTRNFKFEKKDIRIKDGWITDLQNEYDISQLEMSESIYDASGTYIIPGLTDIHFHGCAGYDFCDGTKEAISNIAKFQLSKGVTNICPATMTLPKQRLLNICETASKYKSKPDEADLVGIHMEGPFISPNRCGAQNPNFVQKADADMIQELISASGGLAKIMTIAPEVEDALACIKKLKGKIQFSIGHTCAGYTKAKQAFDAGARHVTHLFNAMPPLTHREPGVIGAAAETSDVMAEIICDGIHIHPSVIRTAFRMFGDDRIILISDSTRACGMPDGEYELGGLPVFLKEGAVRLEDGTLAGSGTNLFDCMVHTIRMGIPKESAIRAATYNPAKAIGILADYGTIEIGKKAKLVVMNKDYACVNVFTGAE